MANRHRDWLRQSEADLAAALDSLAAHHYEWACFAAHQAAEKAVKALYLKLGADAWGHTITPLPGGLPEPGRPGEDLLMCAKVLDKHYIPTTKKLRVGCGRREGYATFEMATSYPNSLIRFARRCATRSESRRRK